MKVNFIPVNNYNINNNKLNNGVSKPVFKGQKFARILKENYKDTQGKDIFDLFKDLLQKASEEKRFKIKNNGMFSNLKAVKNIDDLVSLLETWHTHNPSPAIIAKDSSGPILDYVVFNPNQTVHTKAIKELRFSSKDKDGLQQTVSFQTTKFADDIAHAFTDSNGCVNFYRISEAQYKDIIR